MWVLTLRLSDLRVKVQTGELRMALSAPPGHIPAASAKRELRICVPRPAVHV